MNKKAVHKNQNAIWNNVYEYHTEKNARRLMYKYSIAWLFNTTQAQAYLVQFCHYSIFLNKIWWKDEKSYDSIK